MESQDLKPGMHTKRSLDRKHEADKKILDRKREAERRKAILRYIMDICLEIALSKTNLNRDTVLTTTPIRYNFIQALLRQEARKDERNKAKKAAARRNR